jgi:Right handed beta helix region
MARLRVLVAAGWVVAALAGSVAVAPGATAQTVGDIDATGAADVTAELQALFDGTPDGGVIRLAAGGAYRVEGTIVLRDRHDLVIDGNGARIFATTTGAPDRCQIKIQGGSGLKIRNLEIQGANPHAGLDERAYDPEREFQAGLALEGVTDLEVDRVNIHDTYGDHIFIGRLSDGRRASERIWIHDSSFARSGRQGIAIIDGRDVVIERNWFTDMRRATVDLEPVGELAVENIHIIDNEVGPGRLLFVAAGGGAPTNRVVIARNTLHGRPLTLTVIPPEDQRRQDYWVIDNTTDFTDMKATLAFTRTDGAIVRGNRQPLSGGAPLVVITDSCDIGVTDNDLTPSTRAVEGESRECNHFISPQPPDPPPVAGRGQDEAMPPATPPTTVAPAKPSKEKPPVTPASTPATSAPEPGVTSLTVARIHPDDGVAVPVVVLVMVLAALAVAGAALAVKARRSRS